ncbi:hypothetical protein PMAYCL1PPCAC_12460, partial [Pristionchus mayeri]
SAAIVSFVLSFSSFFSLSSLSSSFSFLTSIISLFLLRFFISLSLGGPNEASSPPFFFFFVSDRFESQEATSLLDLVFDLLDLSEFLLFFESVVNSGDIFFLK